MDVTKITSEFTLHSRLGRVVHASCVALRGVCSRFWRAFLET